LEWQDQYGDKLDWFMKLQEDLDKKAEKAGKESTLLPALAKRPEIFQDLVIFYNAFNAVSPSRQSGMGLGYIPLSEIRGYLDEFGVCGTEARLEWINWIQFIDRTYVRLHSEKKEKEAKSKTKSQRGNKK
jgi:hypothetical protein